MAMDQGEKFEVIRELGRCSFGSVVLARKVSTGQLVAIKKLDCAHLQHTTTYNDILTYSQLRHPHLVQFREVFLSPEHFNIVMHYVNGGSLFTYVKSRNRLREPLARWFFQQLMLAVEYCHKKDLAVIDIKLENILLQDIPSLPRPLLKLIDFGYCEPSERHRPQDRNICLAYASPEAISDKVYDGQAADMWGCGVVLYTMLTGRYPFNCNNIGYSELREKMRSQEYNLPESLKLTPDCKNLIRGLLNPDSNTRIKMSDVLQNPWFKTDLPPDALSMNDKYLAQSRARAPEDVVAVIAAARKMTQEAVDRAE